MNSSLSTIDFACFGLYFVLMICVGAKFSRQSSLKGYLLADQDTHFVLLAISVIAALFSGITFLGAPAETYKNDLQYIWTLAGLLIATPLTALVFAPLFYRLKLFTAYEYLERRFDRRVRLLASSLFILRVCFWLGIATYAPALIISQATGWPIWLPIVMTGALTTFYTCVGGMKAVIWTDAIQFCVLMGGIVAIVLVAITHVPGGLPVILSAAQADGKTKLFDFNLDPHIRVTFWAAIVGGTVNTLVQMVTDQVSVQRYLSAVSIRECQRAMWLKLALSIPVVSLFYLSGTIIYGYYKAGHLEMPKLSAPDQLLPNFVLTHLPTPLPGLLMAAILGATMSTTSAGLNALTGALLVDFLPDTKRKMSSGETDAKAAVLRARMLTVGFGTLVTSLALFAGKMGTLVEAPVKAAGLLGGPLLAVFLLGAFSRRVDGTSMLAGVGTSAVAGGLTMYFSTGAAGDGLKAYFNISFLWLGFIEMVLTIIVAHLVATFVARNFEVDQECLHRSVPEARGTSASNLDLAPESS